MFNSIVVPSISGKESRTRAIACILWMFLGNMLPTNLKEVTHVGILCIRHILFIIPGQKQMQKINLEEILHDTVPVTNGVYSLGKQTQGLQHSLAS